MSNDDLKVWQTFEGNNFILCGGRCITGKNTIQFLFCLFLIVVCSILFLIFDCLYFYKNYIYLFFLSFPMTLFLSITTICLMLAVTFTDPGILPRARNDEALFWQKRQYKKGDSLHSNSHHYFHEYINVPTYGGRSFNLKYCQTCRFFRPLRTSHCRLCDNCVVEFDHHCDWLSNCIGKRNYGFFYLFLLFLTLLIIDIFSFSLLHYMLFFIQNKESMFHNVLQEHPTTMINLIICPITVFLISALLLYHTKISIQNLTSYEDIKLQSERLVYHIESRRGCKSFINRIFGERYPSTLQLQESLQSHLDGYYKQKMNETKKKLDETSSLLMHEDPNNIKASFPVDVP